jgi:hypothetical protein
MENAFLFWQYLPHMERPYLVEPSDMEHCIRRALLPDAHQAFEGMVHPLRSVTVVNSTL